MRSKKSNRNAYVVAMTLRHSGNCVMQDRRQKRSKNPKKSWVNDNNNNA